MRPTVSPDLGTVLAEAARQLGQERTTDEALTAIVENVRVALPQFDHVGISTVDRQRRITTRASTGPLVQDLDDLQYDLNEGPCYAALQEEHVVLAPYLRQDQRWPHYVPRAVENGVKAQMGVRLYVD